MTEKFVVTGMTCAACAAHVEKAASSLDGVDSAAVNLMLGTLVCSYDADRVSPQAIITAVEAAGYGAAPADDAKRDIRREQEESARAMGRITSLPVNPLTQPASCAARSRCRPRG